MYPKPPQIIEEMRVLGPVACLNLLDRRIKGIPIDIEGR